MCCQGFRQESVLAACFQSVNCQPDRAIRRCVLLRGKVELGESFIHLRASDTVSELIKEFSRPLKVYLRFIELVKSEEKVAVIIFDDCCVSSITNLLKMREGPPIVG